MSLVCAQFSFTVRGKKLTCTSTKEVRNGSQVVVIKCNKKLIGTFLIEAITSAIQPEARRNRIEKGLTEELARQAFREYAPDTGTYKVQTVEGMQWKIYQHDNSGWVGWFAFSANDGYEFELEEFEPTKSIADCVVLEGLIHAHLRSEGQL